MSRLILIVVWLTIAAIYTMPAQAYEYQKPVTYSRIGNSTYGSDGSTQRRIGSSTFITESNGRTTTCSSIGSTTYCN